MLERDPGRIVGCNIVAGVENRLIERRLAKAAFEWLGRLAADRGYTTSMDLVESLRVLQGGDYPRSMPSPSPPPEFRLRGERALDVRGMHEDLSIILPARLLNTLIHPRDRERLRDRGLVFPSTDTGSWSRATVARWRRRPAAERRVRFDPNQTLGRHRSVLWFARRRDVEASLGSRSRNGRAQRGRDRLGLVHHRHGVILAAMHFPPGLLERVTSARPTFLDAAEHRRFRTWPDGPDARANRHWGCTVDLAALARSDPNVDGCLERVTAEIAGGDLPDDGRFEFDLLGPVAAATGTHPADDVAFSDRLRSQLGGLSVDELRARLKSYL